MGHKIGYAHTTSPAPLPFAANRRLLDDVWTDAHAFPGVADTRSVRCMDEQSSAARSALDAEGAGGGRLTVGLLGPLLVARDGAVVEVGPAMVRNLLALLALHPAQVVTRGEIVSALWGDDPPSTYANIVHGYASRLRTQLRGGPDEIRTTLVRRERHGYRLGLAPDAVDLHRYTDLVTEARRAARGGDHAAALDGYEAATRCWRGPALEGLEQRLCRTTGRPHRAVELLRGIVETQPLHEGMHAQLMAAQADAGDRAGALATYAALSRRLADELGVDPGSELRTAYLRLLREDAVAATTAPARRPGPDAGAERSADEPCRASAPVPARGSRRPRRRPVSVAAAVLVVAAAVTVGAGCGGWRPLGARSGRSGSASATAVRSLAPAGVATFASHSTWKWAYGPNLGRTATRQQRVAARVSGLVDGDHCAGFRLRVGGDPRVKGDTRGALVAVCGDKWEIEAGHDDDVSGPCACGHDTGLVITISADDVVTIAVDDTVIASHRLRNPRFDGRGIVPELWQSHPRVRLEDIRTNATGDALRTVR